MKTFPWGFMIKVLLVAVVLYGLLSAFYPRYFFTYTNSGNIIYRCDKVAGICDRYSFGDWIMK